MVLTVWPAIRAFSSAASRIFIRCSLKPPHRVPLLACSPAGQIERFSSYKSSNYKDYPDQLDKDSEFLLEVRSLEEEKLHDRQFEELTVEKYESLIQNDDDRQYIRKVLDDYEYIKYCTSRVPSDISVPDMARLIQSCRGASDKTLANFFNFLFKKQMMKLANKRLRHRKAQPHHEKLENQKEYEIGTLFDPETLEPIYRKWHNSLLMRLKAGTMTDPKYWRLFTATKFAPKIVIDNSFSNYMDHREVSLTADQLGYLYGENSSSNDPFDLWFCNFNSDPRLTAKTELSMPHLYKSSLITLEERSYLDVFPKKNLIYLTPDAPNCLVDFTDDDILIIGALVDKTITKPLSMAKARMEGLRMARLPIDEHVMWGKSTKSLTLNQVVKILAAYRKTRDWRTALLEGVPARKLKTKEEIEEEHQIRVKKLMRRKRFSNKIPNEYNRYERHDRMRDY